VPAFFASFFKIGSHFYAWASLDYEPRIYASQVAGMKAHDHDHDSLLLVQIGSRELFARGGLES
jgi:hypothetical protein